MVLLFEDSAAIQAVFGLSFEDVAARVGSVYLPKLLSLLMKDIAKTKRNRTAGVTAAGGGEVSWGAVVSRRCLSRITLPLTYPPHAPYLSPHRPAGRRRRRR